MFSQLLNGVSELVQSILCSRDTPFTKYVIKAIGLLFLSLWLMVREIDKFLIIYLSPLNDMELGMGLV